MALAHHETFLVEEHAELMQGKSSTMLLGIAKELKDSISQVTRTMAHFSSKDNTGNVPLGL